MGQAHANNPMRIYIGLAVIHSEFFTTLIVFTQMTKADMLARWGDRDHVVDFHVTVCDHHTVNEQLDQLAALREGGVRKPLAHPLAQCLNGGHDLADCLVLVHLRLQLLPLPL
jgi:hypothetical protein